METTVHNSDTVAISTLIGVQDYQDAAIEMQKLFSEAMVSTEQAEAGCSGHDVLSPRIQEARLCLAHDLRTKMVVLLASQHDSASDSRARCACIAKFTFIALCTLTLLA